MAKFPIKPIRPKAAKAAKVNTPARRAEVPAVPARTVQPSRRGRVTIPERDWPPEARMSRDEVDFWREHGYREKLVDSPPDGLGVDVTAEEDEEPQAWDQVERLLVRPAVRGPRGGNTQIQSLLFDRSEFSQEEAHNWAIEHGFSVNEPPEGTANLWRIRQQDPKRFAGIRTIPLRDGIQATVGLAKK